MKKSLLPLLAFYLSTAVLFAQTDRAEYGSAQEPIVGAAITSTGAVYSFSGGLAATIDGNFFPDTLSLDGVNDLVRQEGSPLGNQTTIDTWWSPSTNTYYLLEMKNFNCDVGNVGNQIVSFSKDDPSQMIRHDILYSELLFEQDVAFAVAGDRYVIVNGRNVITSTFSNPSDTTHFTLQDLRDARYSSIVAATEDRIFIADGTKILTVDADATVSETSLGQPIIGLGLHGLSTPDVFAILADRAYELRDGVVVDTLGFNEPYTFESLVMNANSNSFLCTYKVRQGALKYGRGSSLSSINVTSFTDVDTANPGRYTSFVQANTSEAGNARSVAVLQYDNSPASILMSTQNEIEFVDLDYADVELVDVELQIDFRADGFMLFNTKPIVRNNSSEVIESIQMNGPHFILGCPNRDMIKYTDLGLQPNETRQLDVFQISFPAVDNDNGAVSTIVELTTANNFPIIPGNIRTGIGSAMISSSNEAFAKTLTVYPNPAQSTVQVELPEGATLQSVMARDLLGREVKKISFVSDQLNVSNLGSGSFLLDVQLVGGQHYYAKVVIR